MDSQNDLNRAKASNLAENRRNCKIHTKPDGWILETAPKQVSSVMDMNIPLPQNNYLRFGITYRTGLLHKD